MKFSEMPYQRPDLDAVKQQFADLCARFKAAESYAERARYSSRRKSSTSMSTRRPSLRVCATRSIPATPSTTRR